MPRVLMRAQMKKEQLSKKGEKMMEARAAEGAGVAEEARAAEEGVRMADLCSVCLNCQPTVFVSK